MASEVVRSRVRWGVVMVVAVGLTLGAVLSERIEERKATRIEERASFKAATPGGTGELLVSWDKPTQYTDDSRLFLKTHEVCWGTQSGSYPNCVDLSTTQYPGMLEYRITNLEIGTQYFVVVRAIDSEDSKSADSTEASLVVTAYVPESITWTDFSGGTISSPGDYRLTGDVNSGSGNAISINSGGVRLNCDNYAITFATSGSGNGINIGTAADDIEIYNCNISQGGNNLGYAIGRDSVTLGNNIKIHDNTINMNFASNGGITFDNYDVHTSGHEIYRNTIFFTDETGDHSAIGARERSWNWFGKIYENTIQMQNCTYTGAAYPSAIWPGRGSEVYKNDITMTADNFQVQGFQGWGIDNTYFHDNTINTAAELTRIFLMDGGADNVDILWNTCSSTNTTSEVGSCFRIRYGSNNVRVGFNDFSGTGAEIACRTGSYDSVKGDSFDLYFYHNDCTSTGRALTVISAAHDYYFWSNTFDGTASIEGTADPANLSRYLSNINFHFDTFIGTNITANPRSAGFDLVDNNLTFCQVPNVTSTDDLTWIGANPNERGGVVFPQSNCLYPVSKTPRVPTNVALSIPAPVQ